MRAEEFINYFDYGHAAPATRDTPFRVTTELAPAPWNAQRQLLMVGIKGYDVPKATLAAGQPRVPDRHLRLDGFARQAAAGEGVAAPAGTATAPQDRVSMVVYAGSAGLVLPPTPGDRHDEILAALDRLEAGGSTNGGDGIRLAYAMAKQAFVDGGVNRVILATDGDFNVGTVDQNALETLVADQRKQRHRADHARLRQRQLQRRDGRAAGRRRRRQPRLHRQRCARRARCWSRR